MRQDVVDLNSIIACRGAERMKTAQCKCILESDSKNLSKFGLRKSSVGKLPGERAVFLNNFVVSA